MSIRFLISTFGIELNRQFNFRNRIENRFNFNYFEIESNQIESIFDLKIEMESNCQEIENYVIILRITIFRLILL